jgi:hypothetical protein
MSGTEGTKIVKHPNLQSYNTASSLPTINLERKKAEALQIALCTVAVREFHNLEQQCGALCHSAFTYNIQPP